MHLSTEPVSPNIGAGERSRRRMFGLVAFLLGAAGLVALVVLGVDPLWRLMLLPLWWAGMLGVLQAREGTWVALAARGARNMDTGEEPVEDEAKVQASRRRAQSIHTRSLLFAGAVTVLSLLP